LRLTVETGPLAGTVVSLDRDRPAHLGSGPDCAVRVQEAGVAPQHAVVKALRGEGFGIKALAPGLRVNGQPVEATPLEDGDVIELGTTRIAYGQVQKRGLPTVAGYRIAGVLGRGGMGTVYRAEQVSLHREVALKVLSRELTKDPQFVAKFVAEARAAAKLQHPNVVAVFDVEHAEDTYYYAMELMQGSLEDELKKQGALAVDRALRVVADAAAGLAYAESLGIVHRDIKPDNLMLDQHGVVKIADLGLARSDDDAEEQAIGTPHFMAPEQVLKKEIDHRTDLYALGCTFYRLLTNRTPFRGQTVKDILRAQVKDDAEPVHKVNNAVPAEVSAIVQRLMAKEPKDRYQTANDLLEDLQRLLQPPAKKGLWIALAAAGVAIAGGAVYYAVTKPKDVITEKVFYDDPEKQRFADENVALRLQQKEDRATIALLEARLADQDELALASTLEQVAKAHPDTKAAIEARQRADHLRAAVAERQQRAAERRQRAATHLDSLRTTAAPLLAAGDFAKALAVYAAKVPAEFDGEQTLADGLAEQRAAVLTAARQALADLRTGSETAAAQRDPAALAAAGQRLAKALAERDRWPAELDAELARLAEQQTRASQLATELAAAAVGARWQAYAAMLAQADGSGAALPRLDFAAVAQHAERFAAAGPDDAIAVRARSLAAAARHADTFAEALRSTLQSAPIAFPGSAEDSEVVSAWDVGKGLLTVVDTSKRSNRERTVAIGSLSPETWQGLAEAVSPPAAGARLCFLTFVTLESHRAAADAFLRRLDARQDQSGTRAEDAYPLGTTMVELLRRRLPAGDDAWLPAMRDELDAAARLVAGLRALSERRHLAAATHLEKLLADHPHSYLVLRLP
jgi:hypothetical protein